MRLHAPEPALANVLPVLFFVPARLSSALVKAAALVACLLRLGDPGVSSLASHRSREDTRTGARRASPVRRVKGLDDRPAEEILGYDERGLPR